MGGTIFIESSE